MLIHIVIELIFAAVVGYLLLQRRLSRKKKTGPKLNWPSEEEQQRRLEAFQSVKLREDAAITSNVEVPSFAGGLETLARDGVRVTVSGGTLKAPTECLDLCSFDYHGLSTHEDVTDVARRTVMAYGVGSCGPRNFYGTIKPHLDCEEDIAKFLGTQTCVVYSFSYATVSTLISCFAGRSDYLVCDAAVSHATREGCTLSRSKLSTFEHNDMASLEKELQAVVAKENPKKPNRRFVVTEGVFKNTGEICPLDKIVALCDKYKFRLILEDSFGFGALGKTGRGTPEHFGIPLSKVEIYIGTLHAALGAVGGFCAGSTLVGDFQRMIASAYVFSASLPPYMTAAASESLRILQREPQRLEQLQSNARALREALVAAQLPSDKITLVHDGQQDTSPIVVLQCVAGDASTEDALQRVVNAMQQEHVIVTRCLFNRAYTTVRNVTALRIIAKGGVSTEEIADVGRKIGQAIKKELA